MGHIDLLKIPSQFNIPNGEITFEIVNGGRINQTYKLIIATQTQNDCEYILQRINASVFKHPQIIMKNLFFLNAYVGESKLSSLEFIETKDGKNWCLDNEGYLYRLMPFIENSEPDREKLESFYEAGKAVGQFHLLYWDFPVEKLSPVIPGFHHTENRFKTFKQVIQETPCQNRVLMAQKEIEFLIDNHELGISIINKLESGKLSYRVTHNDTKIENILFDERGKSICLIDLDTVMGGAIAWDFGDSIRSMANLANEEETDLSKVYFSLDRFQAFTHGYASVMDGIIQGAELNSLLEGCFVMAYEQGLRFLTDFIDGDHYYPIQYDNQNLVRAQVQLEFLRQMLSEKEKMETVIEELFPLSIAN